MSGRSELDETWIYLEKGQVSLTDTNVRISCKKLRFSDGFEKTSLQNLNGAILRLAKLLKER